MQRYVKQFNDINLQDNPEINGLKFKPNHAVRKIFTSEEENDLVNYLTQASASQHGLPPKEARKLTFKFAVLKGEEIPPSWEKNECASED